MRIQDICYTSILYISLDCNSTSQHRTHCTPYSRVTYQYFGGFWQSLTFSLSFSSFEVLKEIHLSSSYYKHRKALQVIYLLPPLGLLAMARLMWSEVCFLPETCGAITTNSTDQFPPLTDNSSWYYFAPSASKRVWTHSPQKKSFLSCYCFINHRVRECRYKSAHAEGV